MDIYTYCDVLRLAPDLPVPVLREKNPVSTPGMAMNVFSNIKRLRPGVHIKTNDNWPTITKNRFVHDTTNHMFFRVDSGDDTVPVFDMRLMDYDYDMIVISDYDKGFLTEQMISDICEAHSNVLLDTKKILGEWAHDAKYIKINDVEYRNSMDWLYPALSEKIIRTTGPGGCEFQGDVYPVDPVEVKDVSGAGDTFLAALAVKYDETGDIIEGIRFANQCASDTVRHRGMTTL
jgi:D-glycero-beta-D-manno-heptose-7-phosphate kinase